MPPNARGLALHGRDHTIDQRCALEFRDTTYHRVPGMGAVVS